MSSSRSPESKKFLNDASSPKFKAAVGHNVPTKHVVRRLVQLFRWPRTQLDHFSDNLVNEELAYAMPVDANYRINMDPKDIPFGFSEMEHLPLSLHM